MVAWDRESICHEAYSCQEVVQKSVLLGPCGYRRKEKKPCASAGARKGAALGLHLDFLPNLWKPKKGMYCKGGLRQRTCVARFPLSKDILPGSNRPKLGQEWPFFVNTGTLAEPQKCPLSGLFVPQMGFFCVLLFRVLAIVAATAIQSELWRLGVVWQYTT